jgi:two-component system, sensor histidine kinase
VESQGSRLEALGRTTAELLHDLAADLEVLRGWAKLVADGVRSGRATPLDAAALEEEADRVGRLLAEVVDWMADPSPRSSFSPLERLRSVMDRIDRREGVVPLDLSVRAAEGLHLSGPPTFFDRVAANLIRNAVRHADRRVRVSLSAESRAGASGVRLRVEDDGSGVDSGLRGSLFTPFARGARHGHGLGLSSTSWLAEQLGGTVREPRASALGGASFEVWFPVRAAARREERAPFPLAGVRVLLVDDDPTVRRVLVALLRSERMQAEGLDFAPDLVDRLTRIDPDLILLDRHLGHHSGLAIWRSLGARDPDLASRTALLTGAASPGDDPGGPTVLLKPLDLDALRAFAARVLASRRKPTPEPREGLGGDDAPPAWVLRVSEEDG